jgi:glycerophosphoryl diester phosphodiesterase
MSTRPVFDRPVAHRGLHDRINGVIENSRSAFAAAIAKNFAIECDLQLTSDGVAVMFHDDDVQRLTGKTGWVRDYTAAEFTKTPLLDSAAADCPQTVTEFLAQIGGTVLLQIELKKQKDAVDTERLAKAAAAALAVYNGKVTVESFDPRLLSAIRRAGYAGPLGIITYDYNIPEWDEELNGGERFVLRHLLHAPWSGFTFISCYQKSLELPAVRFWRALGVPVTAWTIRTEDEARAALAHADQLVFEGFNPVPI